MQKLTVNDVRRVFALYYGSDYLFQAFSHDWYQFPNGFNHKTEYHTNLFDVEQQKSPVKLLLKNLIDLTELEMFELCKLVAPDQFGDFRFSKWQVTKSNDWDDLTKCYYISNPKSVHTFEIDVIDGIISLYTGEEPGKTTFFTSFCIHDYWQWYLAHGYAIPIYPFNENPFQLGLAVDIKEYETNKASAQNEKK